MTLPDDVTRMLAEVNKRFEGHSLLITGDDPPPTLTVKQHAGFISVSTEQALDAGLITEEQARAAGWTPYVPLPVPWHRRLRWRWQSWRERAGRRVGGWIAGVDLTERDED